MGIQTITPFERVDISQNTSAYSRLYSLRDLLYGITDQEIGAMVIASSDTDSNSITIGVEGSFDGANFNTAVVILTTTDIGDGNPDYVALNLAIPYPFVRFKATENNNGDIVDLVLIVSYPTSEVVR